MIKFYKKHMGKSPTLMSGELKKQKCVVSPKSDTSLKNFMGGGIEHEKRILAGKEETLIYPLQREKANAGISQETVASALDCDTRTVKRYEVGEQSPTQEMILITKDLFKCEIADLFPTGPLPLTDKGEEGEQ